MRQKYITPSTKKAGSISEALTTMRIERAFLMAKNAATFFGNIPY